MIIQTNRIIDPTQQFLSKTIEASLNKEKDTNTDECETTDTKNEDKLDYDFLFRIDIFTRAFRR